MRKALVVLLVLAMVVALTGCASLSRRDKGVLVGAGAGAAVGGVIGSRTDNTALGAILGAAVGGAAGGVIGNYMDDQAEEMREDLEGATVTRVGEGIKITFDSGILFDIDSATLRPAATENLADLADILQKYEDTNILLEGHTDSSGPEDYNMNLSERRARSVAGYLGEHGVDMRRMSVQWYGEMQPIADNETAEGRQLNRRVEVAIMANEELKEAAREKVAEG